MIGLGWLAFVRTDYRDSANNESHQTSDCRKALSTNAVVDFATLRAIATPEKTRKTLRVILLSPRRWTSLCVVANSIRPIASINATN